MAKKDDKTPGFEQQLEALQKIVDQLESGEVGLEPSLELFERGVGLYKQLRERLESAEARVEKLVYDLEGSARRLPVDEPADGADDRADD